MRASVRAPLLAVKKAGRLRSSLRHLRQNGAGFSLCKLRASPYCAKRGHPRVLMHTARQRPGGYMPIVNRIADLHPEITAWRRDIHAHPELLYDVQRTAAVVADKLRSFGCDEVVTG